MSAVVLLGATLIDRLVGDPDWLWRRLPHPVVGFGWAIAATERGLNRPQWPPRWRKASGIAAILALLALAAGLGFAIEVGLRGLGPAGLAAEAVVASVLLAQKSLADHVRRVAVALETGGVEAGRRAVSMIVGRDPQSLDAAGVGRAAIESLAENASDGVVAPWLFLVLFGLPGLMAYKMLNTADSMIGHLDARYREFGYGAARLDDLANWPAARLTAGLFALAALLRRGRTAARGALHAARRDAPHHRSPNAGWPEGAMAGALGLALGGPRRYGELVVDAPMLNAAGRREAGTGDIADALALFGCVGDTLLAASVLAVVLVAVL
ncbi:adenosylcobinamide-phosphate synthase CbiB [Aureimonas pseudogalii]|uniref:Cobalamin biosynthesis protein CobD n=1 Tax=Aureimonas pseudogalii TaxID=1744844 RepID=A0A7W6H6U3_9HYPH|nr:adenosylcobinamide-phosphate synthase CbiB [Aureimonas pseudogalii]MBB3999649.1 adenosylcobinamide-phosphate synthase [Aureimonas pseudogalii]